MKRIMIVDDEPLITHLLKLNLERSGYKVETFPNGNLALSAISKEAPDVLVTDIQMPIMSGKDLCFAIKEQYPNREFPIFVMTSMVDRHHREWTEKISNIKFLEKPLSMRSLIRELNNFFGLNTLDSKYSNELANHD